MSHISPFSYFVYTFFFIGNFFRLRSPDGRALSSQSRFLNGSYLLLFKRKRELNTFYDSMQEFNYETNRLGLST